MNARDIKAPSKVDVKKVEPRIGSLCSGYSGLDMGLMSAIGGTVAWHAENDPAASKTLAHHWPDVPNHGDITTADWSQVEAVDWLTAGYPCPPFSVAGKRKGDDDPRNIWSHVACAIGELHPRRVLLENVAGHVSLGLDAVLWDLAALGYDATWGVVRASDAGAPHRRARVFIVAADPDDTRLDWLTELNGVSTIREHGEHRRHVDGCPLAPAWERYGPAIRRWERLTRPAPCPFDHNPDDTHYLTAQGKPRLNAELTEWMQGLPIGHVTDVTGLSRNAMLRILGNGVVPQQAALAVRTLFNLEAMTA